MGRQIQVEPDGWTYDYLRDDPAVEEDDSLTTKLRGCTEMRITKENDQYQAVIRVEELSHHSKYIVLGLVTQNLGDDHEYKLTDDNFLSVRKRTFLGEGLQTMGLAQAYAQELRNEYNQRFFNNSQQKPS